MLTTDDDKIPGVLQEFSRVENSFFQDPTPNYTTKTIVQFFSFPAEVKCEKNPRKNPEIESTQKQKVQS